MLERDYSKDPAFTPTPERPNDVILAVTRAQHAALRWCSSKWHQQRTDAGTRVLQSLTDKKLATAHYQANSYRSRYRLTAAGRALLRVLDMLAKPRSRKG